MGDFREKVLARRAGILSYGFTPPRAAHDRDRLAAIAERQRSHMMSLPVDAVVLYDAEHATRLEHAIHGPEYGLRLTAIHPVMDVAEGHDHVHGLRGDHLGFIRGLEHRHLDLPIQIGACGQLLLEGLDTITSEGLLRLRVPVGCDVAAFVHEIRREDLRVPAS